MLSYKMDFSFCAWKPGFVKSSHIIMCVASKLIIIERDQLQLYYVD